MRFTELSFGRETEELRSTTKEGKCVEAVKCNSIKCSSLVYTATHLISCYAYYYCNYCLGYAEQKYKEAQRVLFRILGGQLECVFSSP